jgi:glycosyltransferase involved in cell wall biosynthesis
MKVLLITHEYGRRITGGLGRVVNGIFENMSGVQMDIFQIKFPFTIPVGAAKTFSVNAGNDFAFLYRKNEQNKVKCVSSGNFRKVLEESMISEAYDCIHLIVNSHVVAECLRIIKKSFPATKTLYSCHSIVRKEMAVRNNSHLELISEQYIMNTADHIHVLNKTSLRYLEESYPQVVEKGRILLVPNGINEADFLEENDSYKKQMIDRTNPTENRIIFCMSRWSHGKGLEYLLDAASIVSREFNNVRFIIAGRKEQSWENQLEEYLALIDKKIDHLKEYVVPLGWISDQERNTLFHMADVCVMPSQLEYFPYGILEPMVCRVPIVSSRIDSVSELLNENEECLFYRSKNADELAGKLLYLLKHPDAGRSMASKAFLKAKSLYNWEVVCHRYAEIYETMANSKTAVIS